MIIFRIVSDGFVCTCDRLTRQKVSGPGHHLKFTLRFVHQHVLLYRLPFSKLEGAWKHKVIAAFEDRSRYNILLVTGTF